MLSRKQFWWHFCQPVAVALLVISAGKPGWAANTETLKPCTSQSKSESASPTFSDRTGKSIGKREGGHSVEPPQTDAAARNRAEKRGVGPGFCLGYFARNLGSDQKTIWTRPLHLHALSTKDRSWLLPLGAGTVGLVATDQDIMRHFGNTPVAHSNSFSNYGVAAMIGGAATLYLRGAATHDDHSRETGFLAGEAAVNGLIVGEAMKLAFRRPRPNQANAGSFGAGGASFPSEHALAAWSIASVIAHEYPGPLTKLLAYGAASGILMQWTS